MADDAAVMIAVSADDGVYISTDNGDNWTAKQAGAFTACAASGDGDTLAAATANGQVWISLDSGGTWNKTFDNAAYTFSASCLHVRNNDGIVMHFCYSAAGNGGIYKSTDYGSTWNLLNLSTLGYDYTSMDISYDGSVIIAGTTGTTIRVSVNSGVAWTNKTIGLYINDVTMKSDGSVIVVGCGSGATQAIYMSVDSGTSFASMFAGLKQWYGVAMAIDNSIQFSCAFGEKIYIRVP